MVHCELAHETCNTLSSMADESINWHLFSASIEMTRWLMSNLTKINRCMIRTKIIMSISIADTLPWESIHNYTCTCEVHLHSMQPSTRSKIRCSNFKVTIHVQLCTCYMYVHVHVCTRLIPRLSHVFQHLWLRETFPIKGYLNCGISLYTCTVALLNVHVPTCFPVQWLLPMAAGHGWPWLWSGHTPSPSTYSCDEQHDGCIQRERERERDATE